MECSNTLIPTRRYEWQVVIHRVEQVVAVSLYTSSDGDALGLLGNEADVARVLGAAVGMQGTRTFVLESPLYIIYFYI